ncbi:MAG: DUF6036 family nucleotidyltransferase [Clostridiales bacterium]|nr:DUF6036 family nucleotidyltransferase [Clostridiales bacterium]
MAEMFGDVIQNRMKLFDERVALEYSSDGRFMVVIVGGGVLVLRGYISRSTDDIDILKADHRIYSLMEMYDMNGHVNAYINHFPFNYEDRIELFWAGQKVDFYIASLEDIVISKLCSYRGDDLEDANLVANYVDWDLLEKLALGDNELKASILNDRIYNDFLYNYNNYVKRFRLCED